MQRSDELYYTRAPESMVADAVATSAAIKLLELIRPYWAAKNLVSRVRNLLPVDVGSACQRLLNATFHDLREKIKIAGLDLAKQAASAHKLPPVTDNESIDEYSNKNTIDLAYRLGLLTRPDYQRLNITYLIRGNIEHEDEEFEASPQDLIYVFATCIEAVLSKDPIQVLRVVDVKEIVEQPTAAQASLELIQYFSDGPKQRKIDILKYLISTTLDVGRPDIVRRNAYELLSQFQSGIDAELKIELASYIFNEGIGSTGVESMSHYQVAAATGCFPYLPNVKKTQLFVNFADKLRSAGVEWNDGAKHTSILQELEDCDGLRYCPGKVKLELYKLIILIYIGEPGGYGTYGRHRPVFYSDSAAPVIRRILTSSDPGDGEIVKRLAEDPAVKRALSNEYVKKRFESAIELVSS